MKEYNLESYHNCRSALSFEAKLNAMAEEGWEFHSFAVFGGDAEMIFVREKEEAKAEIPISDPLPETPKPIKLRAAYGTKKSRRP